MVYGYTCRLQASGTVDPLRHTSRGGPNTTHLQCVKMHAVLWLLAAAAARGPVTCGFPPAVPHATMTSLVWGTQSHSLENTVMPPFGAEAGYTCADGYDAQTVDASHYCLSDGSWSKEAIVCLESTQCQLSNWTCSACPGTCGKGVQVCARRILARGTSKCNDALVVHRLCDHASVCPVPCRVSPWSACGKCSRACGVGTCVKTRTIRRQPKHGAGPCPSLGSVEPCEVKHLCGKDCVMTPWAAWGACSKTCGVGAQTRHRRVESQPMNGGKACSGKTSGWMPCFMDKCPLACIVNDWSGWSGCTKTCGGGLVQRSRGILRWPSHGGAACPALAQHKACNSRHCPVNCTLKLSWPGPCSQSCGGGFSVVDRTVVGGARYGGKPCPTITALSVACNKEACPEDCQLSKWRVVHDCASCVSNHRVRAREIVVWPSTSGRPCGALTESTPCGKLCDGKTLCKVSAFSEWSQCSQLCGYGMRSRSRKMIKVGINCPALDENKHCNEGECHGPCQLSSFSAWTACSKKCDGGVQHRKRAIVKIGSGCPAPNRLNQSRACNTVDCPQDCMVSTGAW